MTKHLKSLAAKAGLLFALATGFAMPAHAGIPVIDAGNLVQNVVSAIEEVAQTLKQIEEYKTQLDQYENMLKNTAAPAMNIWDDAQSTINSLQNATNTLNYYKQQVGGIDGYLSKFQDVNYYKSSPCFTSNGCSASQWSSVKQMQQLSSESMKKANDAMFKGLDQQQTSIQKDASQLKRLQSAAQGADGQVAALGYANQLASHQTNQLMQIRSLLMAQQNAVATQMQSETDRDAQRQAASELFRKNNYQKSPKRSWGF